MEKSQLLSSLIHAEFNTEMQGKKQQKAYFCVNCCGNSLSEIEVEAEHKDHRVFRTKKNTIKYCYTKKDILSLGSHILDATKIQCRIINSTKVHFIKSRSSKKHHNLIGIPGSCITCGYGIGSSSLFCSIMCKVECSKDWEELDTMRVIMEQQNVGASLKKKMKSNNNKRGFLEIDSVEGNSVYANKRKRSRKGVPKRAPFF